MSSPIIFEKGTRDFSTLGLGLLSDAIQATTTEELNGQFIFEMDYPVSGNNADLIKENRIIVVNSGHILKRQGFIIRQIVRKIDLTMTVYAEHVSYATLDVALAPIGTISGDAKTALENWKRMLVPAVDFTVDSDILTTNSTSIGAPEFETARQGLGGHAGSILDVWGGEYQFDNWHIRLLKQRGKSANAIIAYGRNLISFEQDTNIADTYTSVYPYYQENSGDDGNKTHFLPERTVDSEFVGKYPNPKVLMLDLSNKFKDVADYSETKLRNYALSYIQSNNIGVPKVNMKISTVDLSRATGGFSEDIDLGDTVNVYFEKLGITTSAKVIKAVWNVLSDDYDKFEIGARRASLTESISELATTADENANKALNQALVALQSADGKSTIYYLNSSDPWPTNPNENDTAFVKDGENSIMYRYMFNNDTGMFSWVKILDSMSADQIKQRVSDALESGKAYSDQLVADNVAQVNAVLDDVQAKQADLTAQQAELDTKAQGYANKALADAKANTLATATQTAKDASDALAKAKTDLTTSLNKEVTDRENAVTTLDTKAKGYADTAKADAISAGATADGVINKKIDDTASSITSTISQNKTDADGKITTAQSTATQALNGLATKVSQTVYDAKTGRLQTDLNTTTTTANQAKTDIVAIKSDNTKQDARMTTIESDANGVKTTVSNLQTDLGKANGSITTLQQRADGFDATVTKVNNMAVGGRNWLLDSKTPKSATGNNGTNQIVIGYGLASGMNSGKMVSDWGAGTYITLSFDWTVTGTVTSGTFIPQFYPQPYSPLGPKITVSSTNTSGHYTGVKVVGADWAGTSAPTIDFRLDGFQGVFTVSNIKFEQGNMPTAWTPAPEDVDSATAKAQLTADNATLSINNYKTDADGRISKAQADIIVNANAITQKVSQSDYNAKTGDLTTKVNTAQSTADSATSTIGAYKTSNDARVASAESKITANANAITSKVSQTDYNTKTGQIDGQISSIKQTATSISQSVADITTQVNTLQQVNLINNSDFRPDLSGWSVQSPSSGTVTIGDYDYAGNVMVLNNTAGGVLRVNSVPITLTGTTTVSYTFNYYIFGLPAGGSVYSQLTYLDSAMKEISGSYPGGVNLATTPVGSWQKRTVSNLGITPPTGATYIVFSFDVRGAGTKAGINRPILVKGGTVGDYVPGQYVNNDKISTVSQTVDSISSIVSDPTTGLTKRVQTAEGTLSQVTGADIPALQKATYWQAPNGYDLNTYLNQGSTFFRDTTARTNAPTTSTKWMYLVVERTPNGDRVTQTAWYDTQTDAKITYRRQYAGTWGAWYANDNDSVATIAQTNGVIKTEISDRQKGDTNTLTQAKDFTTSSISNSESGVKSLITQTSDSIIAKVDTKTDSDTVLSLLKDNWSIGIADNAGALASGIAGDLNGMTLISKKITLDGNTTVTGDFYAKGGNFKNLNASNITAGNLDADEVRIINLDVNTLTGDVSRFLETNWNGAYGSTKITSTGMKINTQYIQADFQGFGMDFSYSNKKIGGMGISQYLNGEPGLSMRLESNGAYMAWSARNEGDSTGSYIDKLAWYRQGKPALGGNYGFIFSDRVTFNKPINVEGASINLGFRPINLYGNNFPFFGNPDNITGFAYTSNEIYMVLQNQYVNLSNVIKALSGLGTLSLPTNIDSTGKVTQWRNVTT
ncbi:phage tail spike protein [Leuconostoc lactis]|uniref:phage tail spike protein n=1 Tax=Leuconostoc lactis TaxID=1246 RepID=UPI003D6B24B1